MRRQIIPASVLFILYVALTVNLPLFIRAELMHDDGLYLDHAFKIASGHWLGPFNHFTLMKGPGYPLFVSIASLVGLPLSFSHALLHYLAAGTAAFVLARLSRSSKLGWISFVFILFIPATLDPHLNLVLRDQIYWSQTLLLFSTAALVFFDGRLSLKARLYLGFASGFTLAWAWLTREEGIWFVPGLAAMLVFAGLFWFFTGNRLRSLGLCVLTIMVGFALPQIAFRTINYAKYGSFVGVDFNEKHFNAALGALQSVDDGQRIEYVPMNAGARALAAQYSPTFAPLAEMLKPNGPLSNWSQYGCAEYKQTCGDIAGGWFVWALRDAAAANGFYETPAIAREKFARITREINAACEAGELNCKTGMFNYIPPMSRGQWLSLPGRFWTGLKLISLADYKTKSEPPAPPASVRAAFDKYWTFLNYPKAIIPRETRQEMRLQGWYHGAPGSWPEFFVENESGQLTSIQPERVASHDLVAYFDDPTATENRFIATVLCNADCHLVAEPADGPSLKVSLGRMLERASVGDEALLIETVEMVPQLSDIRGKRDIAALAAINGLFFIYSWIFPAVMILAALAFIVAVVLSLKRWTFGPCLLIATSAYGFVFTRIAIEAIVDATSFPAINALYSLPAVYMVAVASCFALAALLELRRPNSVFPISGKSPS